MGQAKHGALTCVQGCGGILGHGPWLPWHPKGAEVPNSQAHGTPPWGGEMQPRGGSLAPGREINGYPFTTFTDFSDFLGIIPRVSSDDLAHYSRFSLVDIVETIETSPDKKMRVGSLQSPREYDGRLPPDAGCYLNLVIPRFEEPPKKNTSHTKHPHARL